MRALEEGPEPDYLRENGQRLREEYLARVARSEDPGRPWHHPEIRSALEEETRRRCAYCDSEMSSVSWGEVEHIRPKSKRPDLVVEWSNLTLACSRCNRQKSDYDSETTPLLNPYVDEPLTHIVFAGPTLFPQPGDARARLTILRIGLSRADITERRVKRLERFSDLLELWYSAKEEYQEELERLIVEEMENGDFRNTVRAFLLQAGFPLPAYSSVAES